MGVFGYADDLSLLCPTITGLQKMLEICEQYAEEYCIKFNASKSQMLHCSKVVEALPQIHVGWKHNSLY